MTVTIFTAQNVHEVEWLVSAIDMSHEIVSAIGSGDETEVFYKTEVLDGCVEATEFLFLPKSGRGAVAAGADSSWTDCDSLDDLADRWENFDERWAN